MQTDGDLLIMRDDADSPTEMTCDYFKKCHWKPLMQRLGLERYTPLHWRHTCIKMMQAAGVMDPIGNLILGLSHGDLTDKYTHYPDSMLVEAINKLPGRNGDCI